MRTIVHLSDLHFGRIEAAMVEPLIATVNALQPHLVAVSGDLTQRARAREFRDARLFLARLPTPQIVVPGNHDVPLHNLFKRFVDPLKLYRRCISDNLEPFYADDEMAIAGMNTARSLTWKGGRINSEQALAVFRKLCVIDPRTIKIVVTHHPFDLPPEYTPRQLVGRASMALARLARCATDVLLAGHTHLSYTGQTATRYKIAGYSALVVQAGTAISTRGRGEKNSFNVLRLDFPLVAVERYIWTGAAFGLATAETFARTPAGWLLAKRAGAEDCDRTVSI